MNRINTKFDLPLSNGHLAPAVCTSPELHCATNVVGTHLHSDELHHVPRERVMKTLLDDLIRARAGGNGTFLQLLVVEMFGS